MIYDKQAQADLLRRLRQINREIELLAELRALDTWCARIRLRMRTWFRLSR